MSSPNNFRLYSFVANHYLSPLQCGLQTAHVVSELSMEYKSNTVQYNTYNEWAALDKTIIILGAGNHKGVYSAYETLKGLNSPLPVAVFNEDEDSMNNMATACGIIVPKSVYNAEYVPPTMSYASSSPKIEYVFPTMAYVGAGLKLITGDRALDGYYRFEDDAIVTEYAIDSSEGQLIRFLRSFKLA